MKRHRFTNWPLFLATAFFWVILAALIILIDPQIFEPFHFFPFWLFSWLALESLCCLLTKKLLNSLIFSTAAMAFLVLRYQGIGNFINAILLTLASIAFDRYLRRRSDTARRPTYH